MNRQHLRNLVLFFLRFVKDKTILEEFPTNNKEKHSLSIVFSFINKKKIISCHLFRIENPTNWDFLTSPIKRNVPVIHFQVVLDRLTTLFICQVLELFYKGQTLIFISCRYNNFSSKNQSYPSKRKKHIFST